MDDRVFHAGERWVQERTGERSIALSNSRNIGARIPAAARGFVGQQRWCVVGTEDAAGIVSARVLAGEPGFLRASEELDGLHIGARDPGLRPGQSIGVLLIELQTRRRLRINGHVASASDDGIEVAVDQSFPACPRYIQKRQPETIEGGIDAASAIRSGTQLDAGAATWIDAADTLFIATLGPDRAADVSHRGGRPGFVQRQGQLLRIPDYNGNSMFNTLGNLSVEPRCGLVLPDFDGARQLQLFGHARIRLDVQEHLDRTGGTGRWIEFTVDAWRVSPLAQPLRWRLVEASRFNP